MKFQSPYGSPYSKLDESTNLHNSDRSGPAPNQGYEMDYVNDQQANSYGNNSYGNNYGNQAGSGHDDMIQFFADLDEVKKELNAYESSIDRIEQLHTRSLSEVNDENLEIINNHLSDMVNDSRSQGADLKKRVQFLLNKAQNDSTKKTQANNVKDQFQKAVKRYQNMENNFRLKFRERTERQFRTVRPDASEHEVKQAVDDAENGHTQIFAQAVMQSNRVGAAQSALDEVQNRHREIVLINQTVEELANLFRDLELMVAEQEAPIQQINKSTQQAQVHLEQGVAQTGLAVKSARAARRKKWICLGICLLICAIIAIILGVVFGTRK